MQVAAISHASFAGSMKPVLVAAFATGAGVAALASPLVTIGPPEEAAEPPVAGNHLAAVALRVDPGPAAEARFQPSSVRRSPGAGLPAGDIAAQSAPSVPEPEPAELSSVSEPARLADIMAFEPRRPQVAGLMPAAELKAMMVKVAASRGELDPTLSATAAAPDPSPAEQAWEEPAPADEPAADARTALRTEAEAPPIGKVVQTGQRIEFEVAALVNGEPAGRVPLRIVDGENISLRLGDILAALEPMMDKAAYEVLSTSQGADEYVTFNTLREKGIAVGFDADDRLLLGRS